MTLDDFKTENMMHNNISNLLVSVLKQAKLEQKIVSGMYEAAKTLGRNPQDVAFCVLPQNHLNDVERHINHMLMEAFCHENDICILKVDCEEKLAELVLTENTSEDTGNGLHQKDFSCILVQAWNSEEKNYDVDKLICLQEMQGICNQSIIELPQP